MAKSKMKSWKKFFYGLAGIGALNWGLTVVNFNLVNMLLGSIPMLETAVYALVGVGGLIVLLDVLGVDLG